MARTFKATLEITTQGQTTFGKIQLEQSVIEELGLRPGEAVRAQMRGQDFTGQVHGSMKSAGLLVPLDIVNALGLREGQGVRITVLGRP